MSRVIYKSLAKRVSRKRPAGVTERTVTSGGEHKVVQVVDAGRETFGSDLGWVFRRNVARAREENRRLTGRPEGVIGSD